jgi:RHS repeat-associated protein
MKKPPLIIVVATLFFFSLQILLPPGLFACWWKGLPAQNPEPGGAPGSGGGNDDDKPNQCSFGEPVFVHNGDFIYNHQDLFISSRGLNIEIVRTYKSQSRYNGRFGLGWDLNYNQNIVTLSNSDVFYQDGKGKRHRFSYLDGTNYVTPAEVFDRLVQNPDGTYTLTKKEGAKYNFNLNGCLSEIVDRNNNKLTFSYDSRGKISLIGVPLYTKDPITPRLIAYQFMLTQITDSLGRKINLTYDTNGRLTKITDFAGRSVSYTYDDYGHLTSVTDPAGATTVYTYDSDRNLRDIIDPKGRTYLTNTYNPDDQLIAQAQGLATTYYSYDAQEKTATRTDANGNVWTYYFNDEGNPTKIIDPQGKNTSHTYDTNRKMLLTATTDSQGNTTAYEYDAKGNLIKVTDPQGNISTFAYELTFNQLVSSTDALGHTTAYEYDTKGNLIKVTDTLGNTTKYTYDSNGNLLTITDANNNVTTYAYDSNGNLNKITDAQGNQTAYTYDSLGRRTSVTDAAGTAIQYTYNQTDKLTQITYPDASKEQFQYDCCSLSKRIDANGKETLYDYDIHGRLIKVTDAAGNFTQYTYDNLGNLKTIADAEGRTTIYTYDILGRLTRITDPLGCAVQYFYDDNDNLSKKIDANNRVTEYEYNTSNQLIKVFYGGKASSVKTVTFAYDKVGNLFTWNDGAYSANYLYDELYRVKSLSTNYPFGAKAISYTYDKVGNKKTLTNAEGQVVTYNYDTLNRLSELTSQETQVTSYEYDNLGRLSKKTLPNGVYTEYAYNNLNMLLSLVNKKSDATVISSFSYTHDKVGNRLTMATPEGTHNYAYDSLYRLSSADHPVQADEAYTYDKVGNRKTSAQFSNWSFDANNRLLSYNGTTFTYDQNGNTLSKTKDAQTTSYTYDFENRLIAGTVPAGGLSLSYSYDPFGKRLSKTVDGVTKFYLYDNEDIIAEYDQDGSLITTYVHDQGIDEPISMTRGSSTYYYTFDGLGTVSELTDSGQAVVESYKYDAFGKLETPPATGNPYTYTAREYDPESGLYFYRARYYDAEVGRFLSADPIGFEGGVNFYAYVKNNPMNFVDPTGKVCGESWNDPIVPDEPWGFDFKSACQNHDCCCACSGNKSACAEAFLTDLLASCLKYPYVLQDYCLGQAKMYFRVVKGAIGSCNKNASDCCKCK